MAAEEQTEEKRPWYTHAWVKVLVVFLVGLGVGLSSRGSPEERLERAQRDVQKAEAERAKLNSLDEDGETALMKAATKGESATVEQLLAAGADPNIQSPEYGETALMLAADFGESAIVEQLLAAGAELNLQAKGGLTALMWAQGGSGTKEKARKYKVFQILVAAGAELNLRSNLYGNTALMQAALSGDGDAAQVLIAAGAELNLRNKNGMTALMIAKRQVARWGERVGAFKVVRQLQDAGAL